MNEYKNVLRAEIQKNESLMNELKESCKKMFDLIGKDLFLIKDKQVRAKRNSHNSIIFIFTKKGDTYEVFMETIYPFDNKENDREKLKYVKSSLEKAGEIYLPKVLSITMIEKETENNQEKMNELIEKAVKSEMVKDAFNNNWKKLEKIFKKELDENPLYLINMFLNKGNNFEITNNSLDFRNLMELFYDNKLMKKYDDDFYEKLMSGMSKEIEDKKHNIVINLIFLKEIAKKEGWGLNSKMFVFNDLDNTVSLINKDLLITDQNCTFLCKIKDKENMDIYFIDKNAKNEKEEIKRINNDIKNNKVDKIMDLVLSIKNNKVKFVGNLFNIFEFDLNHSALEVERKKKGVRKFDKDVMSYEYQKDYYFTRFGLGEFEFLAQAFLTLGGGFDYDERLGVLADKRVEYQENLKQEKEAKKIKGLNYCYPQEVTYLNKEWHIGLEKLVEFLKKENPKFIAFNEKTSEESLRKAVEYFEKVLLKNNKLKIKP